MRFGRRKVEIGGEDGSSGLYEDVKEKQGKRLRYEETRCLYNISRGWLHNST